jgi:hypothetical protein
MWSFTVVMGNPLRKNRPKMPFVERNYPIETFAPCVPMKRSQCAFACGARTGVFNTCSDIDRRASSTAGAKMLSRSWTRSDRCHLEADRSGTAGSSIPTWAVGEIPMHDSACADVEEDEHVQPLKSGRHDDEEVAGEYGTGMIVEERRHDWADRPSRRLGRDGM